MPTKISTETETQIKVKSLGKGFTLHTQDGIHLSVLHDVSFEIKGGECVALTGQSGSGKSTFMRCLYGNYRVDCGAILVNHEGRWVDLTQAEPHEILAIRRRTIGYVSQFLRVIPRVAAIDVAAEPLLDLGMDLAEARERIRDLFYRLHLPERLWFVSPTTFSGGEKQRVNIARALSVNYPILLLDEPTASLDPVNCQVVVELLTEHKAAGSALIGIFHDEEVKRQVCTREFTFA